MPDASHRGGNELGGRGLDSLNLLQLRKFKSAAGLRRQIPANFDGDVLNVFCPLEWLAKLAWPYLHTLNDIVFNDDDDIILNNLSRYLNDIISDKNKYFKCNGLYWDEVLISIYKRQEGHIDPNENLGDTDTSPSSGAADKSPLRMVGNNRTKALAKAKLAAAVARYEVLQRHSDLSNPRLTAAERRRRARNLVRAYERLRERDPNFQDHSGALRSARSILNKIFYQSHKAKLAAQSPRKLTP